MIEMHDGILMRMVMIKTEIDTIVLCWRREFLTIGQKARLVFDSKSDTGSTIFVRSA